MGPCLRSRCSELGAPFPTRTVPDHPLWCGPARRRSWWTAVAACCNARRPSVWAPQVVGGAAHHLHSDHIAELGDVLITSWVTNFAADPAPLPIIGPPGTAEVVEATLKAFGHDIGYRIAHHADLTTPPPIEVHEYTAGPAWDRDGVTIRVAPTDHRPVTPTIGFRIESDGASVVLAGDTVPCDSLDQLAAGADALVHTVIRKDIVTQIPQQRVKDICDYHSSVQEAAATANRAGVGTLVMTHYVPAIGPGQEEQWRALAATEFSGRIEVGNDLHRVEVHPRR